MKSLRVMLLTILFSISAVAGEGGTHGGGGNTGKLTPVDPTTVESFARYELKRSVRSFLTYAYIFQRQLSNPKFTTQTSVLYDLFAQDVKIFKVLEEANLIVQNEACKDLEGNLRDASAWMAEGKYYMCFSSGRIAAKHFKETYERELVAIGLTWWD